MPSLPPIAKLESKLTKLVYYCVFARDDDKCQVCNLKVHGHNRHPSHVIPKARSLYLRWDMQNIKTLCFKHHMHWWHQNPLKAGVWFKERFPDRAKYLEEREDIRLMEEIRKQGITYREWLNSKIEEHEQILSNFGRTLD